VRFLVDTHCWLWLQIGPERISPELREALEDPANDVFLSAASSWEIAIKHALGKLILPEPPSRYVPSRMRASGTQGLAIEHGHALRAGELPRHHRDPFDRLLVAQAQMDTLVIVTADRQFEPYEVEIRFAT
jgi:PIN domain nuclease of toxin-antitoxin system